MTVMGGIIAAILVVWLAREQCYTYSEYRLMRSHGFRAAMKSDLRNAAQAESTYHDHHGRFTADLTELRTVGGFTTSPDVRLVVEQADSVAWRATATHAKTADRCTWEGRAGPATGREIPHCS